MKSLVCALVLGLAILPAIVRAQEDAPPRIHISNDDPRWGETITISYHADPASAWMRKHAMDTLYYAARVNGAREEHAIIHPLARLSDTLYQATLVVPDSTNALWVEICIPTDRAPDGIAQFTCRNAEGIPTPGATLATSENVDSALEVEMARYPKNYTAYVTAYDLARRHQQEGTLKRNDSSWRPWVMSLISRIKAANDNSLSTHLALGSLYRRLSIDSLSNEELRAVANSTFFDPILNDDDFWEHFFAPAMKKGRIVFDHEPGRIIAPLAARFPHTTMTEVWLERVGYDSLFPAEAFRSVVQSWTNSESGHATANVDALRGIAEAYGYKKSPVYDPAMALSFLNKAEESSKTGAGFYAGENIWGSMDRLAMILPAKARALRDLGRYDEAIATLQRAAALADNEYAKQDARNELAVTYFEAGRMEDAKRAYGAALAHATSDKIEGLDRLYAKAKNDGETIEQFRKRLVAQYGSTADLPAVPNFEFTTLDGKHASLASLRGKVVVLDCWFMSCAGCIMEKPSLNQLAESYAKDTNVVFLSIATDDARALRAYQERTPFKFQIVPNGSALCDTLGISAYPTHILIGRDGKTLGYEEGGNEKEGDLMKPKIDEALGKM